MVTVMDLHPASLRSSPSGIHVSRWWQQEGHHPAIIATIMFPWAVESSPLTVFGVSVTNLNEPPRTLAASSIAWVRSGKHLVSTGARYVVG